MTGQTALGDSVVSLEKKDGSIVAVTVAKLSESDRRHVLRIKQATVALEQLVAKVQMQKKAERKAGTTNLRDRGLGRPKKPEQLAEGLRVCFYARQSSQSGNEGYIHPSRLGAPVWPSCIITSVTPWKYDETKNAVAFGFLKIEKPGTYIFRTYNHFDRNALFVAGELVCPYRGSQAGGTDSGEPAKSKERIALNAGMVPFASVGYVDARGSVDVYWIPPGGSKWEAIPSHLLFHDPLVTSFTAD